MTGILCPPALWDALAEGPPTTHSLYSSAATRTMQSLPRPRWRLPGLAGRADRSTCTPTRTPALRRSQAGADGGFEEGRRSTPVDIVGGSPRTVRASLSSYLLSASRPPVYSPGSSLSVHDHQLITPPSSYTRPTPHIAQAVFPHALPLTPTSSLDTPERRPSVSDKPIVSAATPPVVRAPPNIPLLSSLFPFQATAVAAISHLLEIVTPPDHVLDGFVLDHPTQGRTVFVHLPPPHASAESRPERLGANFSEVLRPHDPHRLSSSPGSAADGQDGLALDIRDSVTALLDLSADSLEAKLLVLVLDKDDRDPQGLSGLLHSLMYAGGQVVRPGALDGGLEWDAMRWVMVGLEL